MRPNQGSNSRAATAAMISISMMRLCQRTLHRNHAQTPIRAADGPANHRFPRIRVFRKMLPVLNCRRTRPNSAQRAEACAAHVLPLHARGRTMPIRADLSRSACRASILAAALSSFVNTNNMMTGGCLAPRNLMRPPVTPRQAPAGYRSRARTTSPR
jgi:hypothetical protein